MVNGDKNLLNNRYRIKRELGRGGLGIVYLAEDTTEQKEVAIKFIKSQEEIQEIIIQNNLGFNTEKFEVDFIKEAMYLKVCEHDFIVKYKDIIKDGDRWCIIMEYIDGQNLQSWVHDKGALSEQEALRYIEQIGRAVQSIHKKGLLHRDINPKNIMIKTDRSEAILIDMGIARQFSHNQLNLHTEFVTRGYAPPEQYNRKKEKGEFLDVYALAATLYYLLTKRQPPDARNRQQQDDFIDELMNDKTISPTVKKAIKQGMELRTDERSQSIEEWFKLLQIQPDTIPTPQRINPYEQPNTIIKPKKPDQPRKNPFLIGGMIGMVYGLFTSLFINRFINSFSEPNGTGLLGLGLLLILALLNGVEYFYDFNLINFYNFLCWMSVGLFLVIINPISTQHQELLRVLEITIISVFLSLTFVWMCEIASPFIKIKR